MSDQEFIFAPPAIELTFAIKPVDLLITSLMLIDPAVGVGDGLAEWVERTRDALSDERQLTHRMVFLTMMKGIDPESEFPDFPSYIQHVEALAPTDIRDNIVAGYYNHLQDVTDDAGETSPAAMLTDRQEFLRVIRETVGAKHAKRGHDFDIAPYAETHKLLSDPTALHAFIVEHLHYMWEYHLRDEWERTLPMLEESVEAFRQLDYSGMTALEAVRVVTGRDLSTIWPNLEDHRSLVFMPSPHIGPYVSHFARDNQAYLIFGARMPEGVQAKTAALTRSELLTQLNALADDTRLTILEMLTHEEELFAQDIMTRLNLSQSSASRHLRQLSATGFLVEKRREVAKYYSLHKERVEDTLHALRNFLRAP
jgi:ArsR family transcriptional regulator